MRTLLNDLVAAKLTHREGQKTAWDTQLRGFGLRIGKFRKTWTVMIGADRQRITLGHYPQMTVKEARKLAHAHLAQSPHLHTGPLFGETIERFIAQHLQPNTKPSSAKVIERLLRHHFSHFANRKLLEITAREIAQYLQALHETPTEANQAHRAIKLLYSWTASQFLIDINPLASLKPPFKTESRDRTLTDDELHAVLTHDKNKVFQIMLKLLAHTAQRRQQIGALKWQNIQGDTLHWTKDEMKGNRPHTLPITPAIKQLLQVPAGTTYLFAGDSPYSSWSKHLAPIQKSMAHFTAHDLRRTTATNMRRLGISPSTVEFILHHAKPKVAGIYDRYLPMREMREALLAHDEWLTSLMR